MKILKRIALVLVGLVAALVLSVIVFERRKFDAPYPDIHASTDPAVIERGRYLATGPALCIECHGDPNRAADREAGKDIPFSGGQEWHFPFGTVRAPNITPDKETGIGRLTDGEIARTLRYGVGSDGRAVIPMMPFNELSDEDLTAVISYLRSKEPVKHELTLRELTPLGHVLQAFILKPTPPKREPKKSFPPEATAAYGEYLTNTISDCHGCHTARDKRTGAFIGKDFAGGFEITSHSAPDKVFISPNLTPDPKTGRITDWTEDAFVARFRMGRLIPGSPMPWPEVGKMTDTDLRAIYKYLRSLPPAENDTGTPVRAVTAEK